MKMYNRYKRLVPKAAQGAVAPWENKGRRARVYLAAHISGFDEETDKKTRDNNERVKQGLEQFFEVFLPQQDNPYGILHDKSQGWEMALIDAVQIQHADIILAVGGFGKDTSWECGFAVAQGKTSILYLPDEKSARWHIDDWMLNLSFAAIIATPNIIQLCASTVSIAPDVRLVALIEPKDLGKVVFELLTTIHEAEISPS